MFKQIPVMLSGFRGATLGRKEPVTLQGKAGEQLISFSQALSTLLTFANQVRKEKKLLATEFAWGQEEL